MAVRHIKGTKLPPAKMTKKMKEHVENMRELARESPVEKSRDVSSVIEKAGFTRQMVELKVADILLMNSTETREVKADEKTSNFDLIIISVIEAAQRNADTQRLDNLLEKIFGKTIKVEGSVKVESNQTMDFADEDLIRRAIERSIRNSQL